jgi:transcriptional regulator with XRE-family HTH domain
MKTLTILSYSSKNLFVLLYLPDAPRKIRIAKKLTATEVAKRAGLTLRGLFYIENSGRDPRASTLGKLSSALGVPLTAFYKQS